VSSFYLLRREPQIRQIAMMSSSDRLGDDRLHRLPPLSRARSMLQIESCRSIYSGCSPRQAAGLRPARLPFAVADPHGSVFGGHLHPPPFTSGFAFGMLPAARRRSEPNCGSRIPCGWSSSGISGYAPDRLGASVVLEHTDGRPEVAINVCFACGCLADLHPTLVSTPANIRAACRTSSSDMAFAIGPHAAVVPLRAPPAL